MKTNVSQHQGGKSGHDVICRNGENGEMVLVETSWNH